MENAVDALKIGFALIVFAIAITLTFSVIGQARITADVVFASTDKTSFYDYAEDGDYNALENRIVSFETLLPTIHRYAKEQYAVTIFNEEGKPIVRYDLYTEGFMGNWNETIKNLSSTNQSIKDDATQIYEQVEARLDQVQSVVNKHLKTNVDIMEYIGNSDTIGKTDLLYYGRSDNNKGITIVSPWVGNPDTDTVDRIKQDMIYNGEYEKNGVRYKGKNLMQYKDRKFEELFIEVATSGETVTDRKRFD